MSDKIDFEMWCQEHNIKWDCLEPEGRAEAQEFYAIMKRSYPSTDGRVRNHDCVACGLPFQAPVDERCHTCLDCVKLVQSGEKPKFNDAKQVILIRKDLQMPAGKLGAQVAHASLACVLKLGTWSSGSVDGMGNISEDEEFTITVANGSPVHDWMTKSFPKITLEVKNENQLKRYYDEAVAAGLPASWIVDAGRTIFNGVPTPTCVGIGPASREQIDAITKRLRVYQ